MRFSSFMYKLTAKKALKGNWQTPMVLLFTSGIFMTVFSVIFSMKIPNPYSYLSESGLIEAEQYVVDLMQIPAWVWIALYGCLLLSILISPMLNISANHYLLERMKENDIGMMEGLFGRRKVWLKAVWLYIRMYVQTFLWSFLLIVPGILAAIRYSMAPYYLASDPEKSVSECLENSKSLMKNRKGEFAILMISFVLWNFAVNYGQIALSFMGLPYVVIMVLAQFGALALNVYRTSSVTAYFYINSTEEGLQNAENQLRQQMRGADMSDENAEQIEDMLKSFSQSVKMKSEKQENKDDGAEDSLEQDTDEHHDQE